MYVQLRITQIADGDYKAGHAAFSAWEQAHYARHGTWPRGWHCRSQEEREDWQAVAEAAIYAINNN